MASNPTPDEIVKREIARGLEDPHQESWKASPVLSGNRNTGAGDAGGETQTDLLGQFKRMVQMTNPDGVGGYPEASSRRPPAKDRFAAARAIRAWLLRDLEAPDDPQFRAALYKSMSPAKIPQVLGDAVEDAWNNKALSLSMLALWGLAEGLVKRAEPKYPKAPVAFQAAAVAAVAVVSLTPAVNAWIKAVKRAAAEPDSMALMDEAQLRYAEAAVQGAFFLGLSTRLGHAARRKPAPEPRPIRDITPRADLPALPTAAPGITGITATANQLQALLETTKGQQVMNSLRSLSPMLQTLFGGGSWPQLTRWLFPLSPMFQQLAAAGAWHDHSFSVFLSESHKGDLDGGEPGGASPAISKPSLTPTATERGVPKDAPRSAGPALQIPYKEVLQRVVDAGPYVKIPADALPPLGTDQAAGWTRSLYIYPTTAETGERFIELAPMPHSIDHAVKILQLLQETGVEPAPGSRGESFIGSVKGLVEKIKYGEAKTPTEPRPIENREELREEFYNVTVDYMPGVLEARAKEQARLNAPMIAPGTISHVIFSGTLPANLTWCTLADEAGQLVDSHGFDSVPNSRLANERIAGISVSMNQYSLDAAMGRGSDLKTTEVDGFVRVVHPLPQSKPEALLAMSRRLRSRSGPDETLRMADGETVDIYRQLPYTLYVARNGEPMVSQHALDELRARSARVARNSDPSPIGPVYPGREFHRSGLHHPLLTRNERFFGSLVDKLFDYNVPRNVRWASLNVASSPAQYLGDLGINNGGHEGTMLHLGSSLNLAIHRFAEDVSGAQDRWQANLADQVYVLRTRISLKQPPDLSYRFADGTTFSVYREHPIEVVIATSASDSASGLPASQAR